MANTLLVDPTRGFRAWQITEIWKGPGAIDQGYIVANVGDMVIDWNNGMYQVTSVDTTDPGGGGTPPYTPTLVLWDVSSLNGGIESNNINGLLSVYQPSVAERIYYNKAVSPSTLSIDDRYLVPGSESVSYRLFKGTNVTDSGKVISVEINGNGDIIGETIDLEVIDVNNPNIKRPKVCHTLETLQNGEVVTLVAYNSIGGATGTHSFILTDSSAIRSLGVSTRTITGIVLESDLLSPDDASLLLVPANIPLTGSDFKARLLYNDGSSDIINIDGVKCKLHHLANVNLAMAGVKSNILLAYYPDANEPVINANSPLLKSISTAYQIQTITNNLDYSFKIYVSPTFNSNTGLYENRYWLTNLEYDILISVPPELLSVETVNGDPVDFAPDGPIQQVRISLLVSNVFPVGFTGYTFVQTLTIQYGQPSHLANPWLLDYTGTQVDVFGHQTHFGYSNVGTYPLELRTDMSARSEWIYKLYRSLNPVYDPVAVTTAPDPTHFRLQYQGHTSGDIPVGEWHLYQNNISGSQWVDQSTVEVVWLLEVPNVVNKQILGVAPVMIHATLT